MSLAPSFVPSSSALEGLIIGELSRTSQLTVLQLQTLIAKRHRRYSLPGIYKAIHKLRAGGVLYKQGDRFGISFHWVLNFSHFAQQLLQSQTSKISTDAWNPKEGEKFMWRFTRLLPYDDFWIHMLLVMLRWSTQSKDPGILYQWIPHPWFHLFQSDKGHALVSALNKGGYCIYNMIGGDTYLDRRASGITQSGVYEYAYAEGPFSGENDRYYSVSGEYVLTHKIDPRTARQIETLFCKVENSRDLRLPEVMALIQTPVKITLMLEHNGIKASRLLRKFRDYFGHREGGR